jgi:hypothetical protein
VAKLRPWELRRNCAFENHANAERFELYLKSAPDRALSKRHF